MRVTSVPKKPSPSGLSEMTARATQEGSRGSQGSHFDHEPQRPLCVCCPGVPTARLSIPQHVVSLLQERKKGVLQDCLGKLITYKLWGQGKGGVSDITGHLCCPFKTSPATVECHLSLNLTSSLMARP